MKTFLPFFLSLFIVCNIHAEEVDIIPIKIDSPIDSFISLESYTTIFVDKSAMLSIEDIKSDSYQKQFFSIEDFDPGWKYEKSSKDIVWLRFKVENLSNENLNLYFGREGYDSISVYQYLENDLIDFQVGGSRTNGPQKKINYPVSSRVDFPISFSPHNSYLFLVKVKSQLGVGTDIKKFQFFQSNYYSQKDEYLFELAFMIGFLSIVCFILFFVLILFINSKDKVYLLYGFYVLTIFLHYIRAFDTHTDYYHLVPFWVQDHRFYSFFNLLNNLSYFLFIRYFINTKIKFPKIDIGAKIIISTISILIVVFWIVEGIDANIAWEMMYWTRSILLIVSLILLIWLFIRMDQMIKYILIGTSFLLLGHLLTQLLNIIPFIEVGDSYLKSGIFSYIGILAELIFFTIVMSKRQVTLQKEKSRIETELLLKAKETDQLAQLDKLKSNFYTNVTHEFRTPLTVIQGMAAELKEDSKAQELIQKNSEQLLQLVNQMLDLSKVESGKMTLAYEQIDVILFLNYMTDSLQSYARQKNINLSFYSELGKLKMDVDIDKLQSILLNLLSNAIKFTPEYGKVVLIGNQKEKDNEKVFEIKVVDSGIGIPANDIPNIFNRYFQVKSKELDRNTGSGIGLALVKQLTEILNGTIEVESEENKGSTFIVTFPITQNASISESDFKTAANDNTLISPSLDVIKEANSNNDLPQILVIEDNEDVLQYLSIILTDQYEITFAKNGNDGIEKAIELIPDIIISDVMMPEKNGFEVCATLKQDERSSHIPIVLLTAKSTSEDKIEGLRFGADAYIMKPFLKEELLVRLEKLLELRQQLQLKYSQPIAPQIKDKEPSIEENFLLKLNALIKENIVDENFTAASLCQEMKMSNSQLYRKLKAVSGFSIANYIRYQRLLFAHDLLENTKLPVSDIAYQSGFTNLSWFSQSFKNQFGFPPNKLRNSIKK